MDTKTFKRRKYLVNKKLQLQFSLLLILQVTIPIIILAGSLFVVNKMYLYSLQAIVGPEALSSVDINGILFFSIKSLIAFLMVTILLLAFMGIRFSHHIAGPIYRLESGLDDLANGKTVRQMKFRKTDVVDTLADKFNAVAKRMNLLK